VLDEVGATAGHRLAGAAERGVGGGEAVHRRRTTVYDVTLQQERPQAAVLVGAHDEHRPALYENGYITYMRTDSTTLSESAINAARTQAASSTARSTYTIARQYTRKVKNAQEAHEAIRPRRDVRYPDAVRRELDGDDSGSTS